MKCLDDDRLLDLQLGEAGADARAHVAQCAACGARLRRLAGDLTRLGTVLHEVPPSLRPRAWRMPWAPLAAAVAALLLGVAVHRYATAPSASLDDTDTLALLDELSTTVLDATDDASDDTEARTTAASGEGRSTCAWGDPLLGVGCNELNGTLVAWR
ncbi:MAG TPA: hypothetical protein VMS22_15725 [Candidatus Eisenbacteria bacterium]|nr:hypothetical protein [Candidatus Eisenbacteria bacterium]